MAESLAVTTPLPADRSSTNGDLVVSLARIMALVYGASGALYALGWVVQATSWDVLGLLAMVILTALCLTAMALAGAGSVAWATYVLVGGQVLVFAAGSAITGIASPVTAGYAVPLALAGILLRRQVVYLLAGLVGILFLGLAVTGYRGGPGPVTEAGGDFTGALPVLSLILVVSMLSAEYSRRLGSALAQLGSRARDLEEAHRETTERAHQLEMARDQAERHSRDLESAKAELERRMADLATATKEIERKMEVELAVAQTIHTTARELAATSSQQASGAQEQAAAMSQIVATMEELSRAAAQIAANSAHVSDLSAAARKGAETGRASVDEALTGLDRIRTEVRQVAERNLELGQKTQAIGEIIEIIREIADRTHLLALNAAIESAAAGEYGRRFGVVASQVKELAAESKSATHQVRSAVAEIQRAASATVLAAEKGEAEVEAGVRLGRWAGDAITLFVDWVEDVALAAREMLLATQQQQSASEQVVGTVREMEQVTRQSAEGSRQISQTVTELMASAERLQ